MALFKPFRGNSADLSKQPLHDGYAYFCTDDGSFYIDYIDTDGKVKRKQINESILESKADVGVVVDSEEELPKNPDVGIIHIVQKKTAINGVLKVGTAEQLLELDSRHGYLEFFQIKFTPLDECVYIHENDTTKYVCLYNAKTGKKMTELLVDTPEFLPAMYPLEDYFGVTSSTDNIAFYVGVVDENNMTPEKIEIAVTEAYAVYWDGESWVKLVESNCNHDSIGEKAEIFNDYENNVAYGDYSHAEGEKNISYSRNSHAEGGQVKSGGRGFKIISCVNEGNGNGYYIVNTTELEGLVVGDRYSVRMASAKYDVGAIVNIEVLTNETTKLTVNNYPNIALEAEDVTDSASYTVENYLTIVGKPHLGNVDIGFNTHVEGEKTIAQDRDAHAEGRGTKAIGQYAHAEGRDTTAAYAAHAEGRGTKARGDISHTEGQNTTASAMRAHAEGYSTTASGNNSHAEGQGTKAIGEDSHAEGLSTTASGLGSHTEGELTQATAKDSHAEGYKSIASDFTAHAEGNFTQAMSLASHSEGANTRAARYASHAEGDATTAAGDASHSEGRGTYVHGDMAHGEGEKTTSFSRNSHAEGGQTEAGGKGFKIIDCMRGPDLEPGIGYYFIESVGVEDLSINDRYSVRLSSAKYDVGKIVDIQLMNNGLTKLTVNNYPDIPKETEDVTNPENYTVENYLTIVGKPHIGNIDIGFNAHSEGEGSIAQDRDSHAEGRNTKAIGQYGHSEGRDTVAAYASHAEGRGTKAMGDMSHAEGQNTTATGNWSHAEGRDTTANGNWSHAEGQNTKAMGTHTHTEGQNTEAIGATAHAEGYNSQAIGISSHAEGHQTISEGTSSHTEGQNTHATNVAAHAEGSATKAFGIGSHAEGQNTEAKADLSHTEGYATKATGTAAHAEGSGAQAIGSATHAEGQDTVAEGYTAHAEGIGSKAQGTGSHAAGLNTIAKGDYQTVIGKFNVEDPTVAFIIGNGNNSSERDNALMVDWNGNMALAGRLIPSDYTNLDERYVRNTGDLGPILNYCGEVSSTSELPETADDGDVYTISQLTVGNNGLIYTGKINELFGCDTEENVFVSVTGNPDNLIIYHTKINLPENYYYDDIEGENNGQPEKWCCFYNKVGNRIGTTAMGAPHGYPVCYDLESTFGTSDPNEVVTVIFGTREDTTQTEWPYGFPDKLDVKFIKTTYCWMNGGWTPIGGNVSNENESEIGKNGNGRFSEIFNDYENNVASGDYSHTEGEKNISFSRNSHAEGGQTKAGGKGFKITSCVGPNMDGSGYYTIVGIDINGIELGVDRYNVRLDNVAYDVGVILEAQKLESGVTELLVSNYPDIPMKEANTTDPENYTIDNYLTIVGKPEIGNINIGFNSHAEGEFTIAQDKGTHAEGRNTMAIGQYGHAEGRDTVAAYAAHAEGRESVALGDVSHAEGCETSATGKFSHAEGFQTSAVGRFAHAEGDNTHADGYNTHAEGSNTQATGNFSHAEGQETKAYGAATHTEGYNTTASEMATAAHAEGSNTQANGVTSHAEGQGTKALGESSHSEGSGTTAHNQYSHAEGKSTHAEGKASHAEGTQSKSTGNNSHAEGEQSIASGMDSHAEGYLTKAFGVMSHAEGAKVVAQGNYSHAEGISQNPPSDSVYNLSKSELVEQWKTNNKGFGVAKGEYSHIEGENTIAAGNGSHAEGRKTLAYGNGSHAEGYYTIANGDYQHVGGKWNAPDSSSLFIIGNGTSEDDRRNALTLDSSENLTVGGKIVPGDYFNFDERYAKAGLCLTSKNELPTNSSIGIIHEVAGVPVYWNGTEWKEIDNTEKIEDALDAIIAIQENLIGGNN